MAGRPIKKGLAYFSSDTDRYQDIKIKRLRKSFGCTGLSIWDYLLNEIYRVEGSFILYDEFVLFDVSDYFNIEENEVNNIILFCSEIGLFNEEILKKHSTLTSRSIQERYVRVCKEAKRTEINLPKELDLINYYGNNLALLPESIELLPESIELIIKNKSIITQSKVKESKVNKSKEDENKEKTSPPPPQIEIDNSLFENLNEDFAKYIQSCINGQMPISLKKDLASKRDTYFQLIKNMNAFNNTIKHQRHRNEDLTAFQKRVDESIVSWLKEQRDGKIEQSWQNIADLGQHAINFFRLQTKKQEQNGTTKRNNGAIETINNDYSGNAGFN